MINEGEGAEEPMAIELKEDKFLVGILFYRYITSYMKYFK